MTAVAQEQRQSSACDECGVTDDLPRHHVVSMEETGMEAKSRHIACCATAGCPDLSCDGQLAGGGAR